MNHASKGHDRQAWMPPPAFPQFVSAFLLVVISYETAVIC